jgi:Tol biopolymer transport system component
MAVLAIVAVLACATAIWLATHSPQPATWSGAPLGGPASAMGPRVSPDGHTIAFQAMIDGQLQVAILKPETGNWTVLTHQKDTGQINDLSWSRDGAKIYFDRETDTPAGVYGVPALGGEPRMVLERAASPQVLADGSLSVVRINAQRESQVYRFWPESGKLESLPAIVERDLNGGPRAMPDGTRLVFYGRLINADGAHQQRGVFVMDYDGGNVHPLAPYIRFQLPSTIGAATPPIAIAGSHDGRSVILSVRHGSLYGLVEVPLDGGVAQRTLLSLTAEPWFVDVAPDGTIYADQVRRGETLLRFPAAGGAVERLTGDYGYPVSPIAVLHDGRPVVQTMAGASSRIAIVEKDGTMSPLIESNEFCGPPATLVGDRHIVARVNVAHEPVVSLAASTDGKTFFYASGGFIWSMPAAGGETAKLGPGDNVAADPNGRDLVVAVTETDSVRLVRVPIGGGPVQPIEARGDVRMPGANLTSGAVGPDGRIAVFTASTSQWAYSAGMVDPRAGTIARIPLTFYGEVAVPMWMPDHRLLASGRTYNFTLWRFRESKR